MKGALLVARRGTGPAYVGKWRDSTGRQVKRVLGPAWLVADGDGWRRRRGRPPDGVLDERSAYVVLAERISAREEEVHAEAHRVVATFADAAKRWLHHLARVKRVKPSTLADYRYLLASPDTPARKRGKPPEARIMRAFGQRPLDAITATEVSRYLARMDEDPAIGPRTINKHRQVLCCVFEHAMREDTFALASNPASRTDKRREPDPKPIDFYETEEVLALVRAAREGRHRDPSRPAVSLAEVVERARQDEQDAALCIVAAFAGLRMGELLALRWRNVDFPSARVVVEASWSAGALTSPKSRKSRAVPLADQPAAALARLAQRERFTGRDDLVFCGALGEYLDPSALRRRYRRAQQAAGLRELRFHDLRHSFGSLVIREFDVASVKAFMGHAKITTTERYLHSRPRHDDAARMTKVFGNPELDPAAAEVER